MTCASLEEAPEAAEGATSISGASAGSSPDLRGAGASGTSTAARPPLNKLLDYIRRWSVKRYAAFDTPVRLQSGEGAFLSPALQQTDVLRCCCGDGSEHVYGAIFKQGLGLPVLRGILKRTCDVRRKPHWLAALKADLALVRAAERALVRAQTPRAEDSGGSPAEG